MIGLLVLACAVSPPTMYVPDGMETYDVSVPEGRGLIAFVVPGIALDVRGPDGQVWPDLWVLRVEPQSFTVLVSEAQHKAMSSAAREGALVGVLVGSDFTKTPPPGLDLERLRAVGEVRWCKRTADGIVDLSGAACD